MKNTFALYLCSFVNILPNKSKITVCIILIASLFLILHLVQNISWDIILQDLAIIIGVDLLFVVPVSSLLNCLERRELRRLLIQMKCDGFLK